MVGPSSKSFFWGVKVDLFLFFFFYLRRFFAFKKWFTLSFIPLKACFPRNKPAVPNEGAGPDKNMLAPSAILSCKVGRLTNLAPPLRYLFLCNALLFFLQGIFFFVPLLGDACLLFYRGHGTEVSNTKHHTPKNQ